MPTSGIPLNNYWVVTPTSQFTTKAYGNLAGTDLFFYVNDTGALVVVNQNSASVSAHPPDGASAPGSITYTLAPAAKWVDCVSVAPYGTVHTYYADPSGTIWYIPYSAFPGRASATQVTTVNAVTFSVAHLPNSTPNAFVMIVDDGIRHWLYVATDPLFQNLLNPAVAVYNNSLDQSIYVTRPSISMHPNDTTLATVSCHEIIIQTSLSDVGFYEIEIPGVS
jgi:hypothetical protein